MNSSTSVTTPVSNLFFPFKIQQEHRISEQAIVLAGFSIQHNENAVLK
jgi:hypothetical protein